MKQDTNPVKQPTLCSPKTVTWIDITKKAMVPSYVSDWKTKINKTAKYAKNTTMRHFRATIVLVQE
jgi:hypothetical protein